MADVTFRIAWNNVAGITGASIFASSEQASHPASAAKTSSMSQGWRSKIGWTVVAGFNDKLDFDEGGANRVATLTPGNYATGALFAAEVQTAMNAAAVSNTYTVTYSTTTFKFTIARATGATAVSLEWSTGANALTGCGIDLGFTVSADDTGATSYVSDSTAYQSRQYLKIDCGSAQTAGSIHLIKTNNWNGSSAVIVQGNATDSWSAPSLSESLTLGTEMAAAWFASASYRYWRVVITDVQNVNGYNSVKVAWLAPYLELSKGVQRGYTRDSMDTSSATPTLGGGMIQSKRVAPLAMSLSFRKLKRTEMLALIDLNESYGVGRPMIIALDPQNYPIADKYMALATPIKMLHTFGDGNPPERWDTTIDLIEVKA